MGLGEFVDIVLDDVKHYIVHLEDSQCPSPLLLVELDGLEIEKHLMKTLQFNVSSNVGYWRTISCNSEHCCALQCIAVQLNIVQ